MERVSGFGGAVVGADSSIPSLQAASATPPGAVSSPSLLPVPTASPLPDDRSAELAILWVKTLCQDRASARRASAAAERRIEAANRCEIAERRAAARDEYRAARTVALAGVVDGACSMVGATRAASNEDHSGATIGGLGAFAKDVSALAATECERAAEEHDVTATEARQRGDAAVREYEQCSDDASEFDGDVARVLDLLRDLLGAERAAESAAIVRG